MAQKRLIDKKISVSEQVYKLPDKAQIIFTWAVPHTDDVGLLPYSAHTLKATVVPLMEITIKEFEELVNKIVEVGLWRVFEYKGEKYYSLVNFSEHQTLKRDRQPMTILKRFKHSAKPLESWEALMKCVGFQMEDNGFQMEAEEKLSKEKLSKDISKKSKKKKQPKQKIVNYTPKDMELSRLLWDLIIKNAPNRKVEPNFEDWAEELGRIHRINGHDYKTIEAMIRWTQQDNFWSQNILSTAKLRKQFDNLLSRIGGAIKQQQAKRPHIIK